MTQNRMTHQALIDQLQGADTDVLRRVLEHAMQRLIEAEAATQISAGPHERASTRTTYRNGYRDRILDTGSGRLELQIPKLRTGSFCPTLLEPRRRIDRALLAVVQEAYVLGIGTRKVDDLMAALGGCSISRSEVSRICALLDEELAEFRERPLDEPLPLRLVRRTYEKVRQGARIVSQAAVVAVGVRETGEKSVLGLAVGASETEAFWLEFCRSLSRRGLSGVQLVISDAHEGLRSALSQVFAGAAWRRYQVHFLRNVAGAVPELRAPAVLAVVKSIFLQPTRETPRDAVQPALTVLAPRFPAVAASCVRLNPTCSPNWTFPVDAWRSIWSTDAIERVNADSSRRRGGGHRPQPGLTVPPVHCGVRAPARRVAGRTPSLQSAIDGSRDAPDGPPVLANPLTEELVA